MKKVLYMKLMDLKKKIKKDGSTNQLIEMLYEDYIAHQKDEQRHNQIYDEIRTSISKIDPNFFISEKYYSLLFDNLY